MDKDLGRVVPTGLSQAEPASAVSTVPASIPRAAEAPMSRRRNNDIKAPDGYTVGGLRLVRKDGTILFGRGWWQAPLEWAGEKVWVHEEWLCVSGEGEKILLEAAHPGLHIYEARLMSPPFTVHCDRTERPDARPVWRTAVNKAWSARIRDSDGSPEGGDGEAGSMRSTTARAGTASPDRSTHHG